MPAQSEQHVTEDSTHHSVKTLISWKAPGRPFKKRQREYYLTGLLVVLLIEIITFLFGQYMLMLAILALTFVGFALASTPPHDFHYKISTEGVTIQDHFYLWKELYDFYFKKREDIFVLQIRTQDSFPGVLTLTLGDMDKEHVKAVLIPYLPYREYVKPTFMERAGEWLAKTFPLERTTKHTT